MKKFFLASLLLVSGLLHAENATTVPAVNGLKDLVAQMDEKAQLSNLIRKAIQFFSDEDRLQELVGDFVATLNSEEQALLLEQSKKIAAINAKAAQPEFQAQVETLNTLMEKLNNPDLTEEQAKIILQQIQQECPLVVEWLELTQELKDLQEAFAQTMHLFPLDLLLAKIIAQLEQA